MCCSWTIVLDRKQQHDMSCASSANAILAEHMRQKIRRDLSRWSRKLLLCLGLENIGKHIVGDSKWEKLYDGCPSSSSTTTAEHEQDQDQDFEPQVRENGTPPPRVGDKSPSNLDRAGVESIQVDVGGGEDDGVEEQQEETEAEQSENIKEEEEEEEEGIEGGERSEEEGMCGKRRQIEEGGGGEDDEVDVPVKTEIKSSPKSRIDKMEEGEEMGEEVYNKEEDEGEFEGERGEGGGDVSRQSPLSTPPSIHGPTTRSMVDPREPESPLSGSEEAAQSAEEKGPPGEGGALVDNLFQILPYWYFLNRAFGMSGGGPGGVPDAAAMMEGAADGEDDDDDGGGSSTADGGGGGQDNGRVSASSPFGGGVGGPPGSSTQRLNSLLLLESLRQLQNQGQQGLLTQDQTLQQQLQISELLSRMSGGAGGGLGGSGGIDPRNIPWPSNAASGPPSASEQDIIEDQPLDLTASCRTSRGGDHIAQADFSPPPAASHHHQHHHHLRSSNNNNNAASLSPFSHLDEQTSKVFRSNPRSSKGYTAQELQAALHDIQSGKLGTRRAAVIYGIPRSTLRNKVYKLGKDRGRLFNNAAGVPNGPSMVSSLHNNNNNNNNNTNNKEAASGAGASASLLGKLSYFHGLSAVQNSYLSGSGGGRGGGVPARFIEDDDGAEESLGQTTPSPAFLNRRAPPSLYAMGNGGDVANKHLTTSPSSASSSAAHHHQSSLSQLISKQRSYHQGYPMDVAMMEESSCHSDDGHPTGSVAPAGMSHKDSWKYALTRHQEQQQQQLIGRQGAVGGVNHHQHHLRQPLPQQNSSHGGGGDDGSSNSLDLAGKKSRPKRGKYRNYDREALVKAVRAVQNGEMSVHRAGSFFGVPHSTLEYKVKERHLLRRPKRKEVTSPLSQPKSTSSPESTSQDATPGGRQHTSAFAKAAAPSSKSILNNNNNNNSGGGGEGGALSSHHPYLFPLTSDLRESLSRYLNQENNNKNNNEDEDRASSGEIMDTGSAGQHEENEDEDEIEEHHHPRLHHHLLAASGGGGKRGSASGEVGGPTAALALEGLIGNRLSNLFQLNDILLRTGSGGGGGGGTGGGGGGEGRPENLLDLSKK